MEGLEQIQDTEKNNKKELIARTQHMENFDWNFVNNMHVIYLLPMDANGCQWDVDVKGVDDLTLKWITVLGLTDLVLWWLGS